MRNKNQNKLPVASCRLRSADVGRVRRFGRGARRHGVLLLVVLSTLVLFLLIGTAFVITAKQSEQAAKASNKAASRDTEATSNEELLNNVVHQMVRDTDNPHSVLRSHSLLADMYGNDGFTAVLRAVTAVPDPVNSSKSRAPIRFAQAADLPSSPSAMQQNPTYGQMIEFDLLCRGVNAYAYETADMKDLYGNLLKFPGENPPVNVNDGGLVPAVDDAYAGQYVYFVNGPARGSNVRIVSSSYVDTGTPSGNSLKYVTLRVMVPARVDKQPWAAANLTELATARSKIVVSGRPFNGTGAGLDPNVITGTTPFPRLVAGERVPNVVWAPTVDGGLSTIDAPPIALLPNGAYMSPAAWVNLPGGTASVSYFPPINGQPAAVGAGDRNGRGGGDESYDAPDFQNMLLAMIPGISPPGDRLVDTVLPDVNATPPQALTRLIPDPNNAGGPPLFTEVMVLPSLHRPELVNFWWNGGAGALNLNAASGSNPQINPALLRKIMMRPSPLDHPNFTGSNLEYEAVLAAYKDNNNQTTQNNLVNRLIYGPWDVDNDQDGVRDSVWVDFGAPVMKNAEGRLVKPMAAILCVDLDGRLNVNTAGSLDMATQQRPSPVDANDNDLLLADGNTRTNLMPRGAGYGPADISLEQALGIDDFRHIVRGANRLNNQDVRFIPGRYGYDRVPGRFGSDSVTGQFGFDLMSQINFFGWPLQNVNQSHQYLSSFGTPPDLRARYGLGLNALGQPMFEATLSGGEIGTGQYLSYSPYFVDLSASANKGDGYDPGPGSDNAYGTNDDTPLAKAGDTPFTLAELERTQRMFDVDASVLPDRLLKLAGIQYPDGTGDASDRLRLTTDSYDVPVPNVSLPAELEGLLTSDPAYRRQPRAFAEILEMRVRQALFPVKYKVENPKYKIAATVDYTDASPAYLLLLRQRFPGPLDIDQSGNPLPTPANSVRVRNIVRSLLSAEMARGERLDLNRPLGNGRDDNPRNDVVDEPSENERGTTVWDIDGTNPSVLFSWPSAAQRNALVGAMNVIPFPPMALVVKPDGTGVESTDQRQLLARQLYVLALTLTARPAYDPYYIQKVADDPATTDVNEAKIGESLAAADRDLARRLAQWAVNVVDFRDADNIMTAFEYDLNPFDGWDVDGDLRTVQDHWGVDGKTATEDDPATQTFDETRLSADDTYVWGCEKPELAITETLAWHDRRTDDTNNETPYPETDGSTGKMWKSEEQDRDKDFDQMYRPRGALFIELFNPSEPNPAASADTHEKQLAPGYDMGVKLDAVDQETGTSPVWRMTFYKRESVAPVDVSLWNPDFPARLPMESHWGMPLAKEWGMQTVTLDPTNNRLPALRPHVPVDRSVYFTGFDPEVAYGNRMSRAWDDDGVAFFNNPTLPGRNRIVVRPGRYMVVGSGENVQNNGVYTSPIGDRADGADIRNLNDPQNAPMRRIDLDTNNVPHKVRMHDPESIQTASRVAVDGRQNGKYNIQSPADDGSITLRVPGDNMSQSMADVAIIDQVMDVQDNFDDDANGNYSTLITGDSRKFAQRTRRLTLSEPAGGYITNFNGSIWSDTKKAYVRRRDPNTFAAIDIPLDGPIGIETPKQMEDLLNFGQSNPVTLPAYLQTVDPVLTNPVPNGKHQGAAYSAIYLQRLANPLIPWNPLPGTRKRLNGTWVQLHDPNRPVNPYITVDSSSANLTVFNSRGDSTRRGYEETPFDAANAQLGTAPDNSMADSIAAALKRFSSHERGYTNYGAQANAATVSNLWSNEPPSADQEVVNPKTGVVLKPQPANPREFVRMPESGKTTQGQPFNTLFTVTGMPYNTLGFLNGTYQDPNLNVNGQNENSTASKSKKTKPWAPFPWLTWNNRPFTNGNEMAMVPTWGPADILRAFSMDGGPAVPAADRVAPVEKIPYPELGVQPSQQFGDTTTDKTRPYAPFAQIGNFYYSGPSLVLSYVTLQKVTPAGSQVTTPRIASSVPSKLYRVLDYVGTPSLYVGTQSWLNPEVFSNTVNPINSVTDPRLRLMPPYNALPTMREPGKINLNTIASDAVYNGMFHGRPSPLPQQKANDVHSGPTWVNFTLSRRGYLGSTGIFQLNADFPTFFANPFRAPEAADLAPLNSMVQRHTIYKVNGATATPSATWLAGSECSIVRSDDEKPASLPSSFTPQVTDYSGAHPLFAAQSPLALTPAQNSRLYDEPARNPFFAYEPMARMAGLSTYRSSVYQVWVTIGFFEVQELSDQDPASQSVMSHFGGGAGTLADARTDPLFAQVYPDGYMLGPEATSDNGAVTRVRGYYVIDRSIPVGFEPGVDHNSDDVVRLKRRIE